MQIAVFDSSLVIGTPADVLVNDAGARTYRVVRSCRVWASAGARRRVYIYTHAPMSISDRDDTCIGTWLQCSETPTKRYPPARRRRIFIMANCEPNPCSHMQVNGCRPIGGIKDVSRRSHQRHNDEYGETSDYESDSSPKHSPPLSAGYERALRTSVPAGGRTTEKKTENIINLIYNIYVSEYVTRWIAHL